jgi:hypothetical protein
MNNYRVRKLPKLAVTGLLIIFIVSGFIPVKRSINGFTSPSGPKIQNVATNLSEYSQNHIPRYKKFEITFEVDTTASNLQLPYDVNPPPGIDPGIGVTVEALFSPDGWKTVYTQPAFYHQEFLDEVKKGQEWFYPTENYSWKVRFSPPTVGTWQYKLRARDAQGLFETSVYSFSVVSSDQKGFIRVSKKDPRYFEFENGTYFPGLSYNMNFDHVSWINPILDNQENFRIMSENGIQLVRIWLSEWGLYGPSWNPWNSIDPNLHGRYIPFSGITFEEAYPGSQVSMKIDADRNPCMFIGWWKAQPAVKAGADYRVRIRYKTVDINGPRLGGHPYGLTAKTGRVLWGEGNYCQDPGAGDLVTPHQSANTAAWQILEGSLNAGDSDFLPNFYLVLENVNSGIAYIDYVWIQEDYGNGNYGPNIVSKPWMAHHLYVEQRNSYAFDKVLELAEEQGIYLKTVLLEKNDWIFNRLNDMGEPIRDDPLCRDKDSKNDPPECPGNRWFYGDWRRMSAVRWHQQAYWRYAQARWGYSTSIHSWELLNEGDPSNGRHHTLADEFGKYMRQFQPNHHLVTTSTWHSFPKNAFWGNSNYPNVDYANYHLYISEGDSLFEDTALASYETSMKIGAGQPGGAGKPVMRGEIGFTAAGGSPATKLFERDTDAVWLHNFVWAGINAGGMLESYWYDKAHIYRVDKSGEYLYDYRHVFARYYNFIKDIPLSNGHYREPEISVSHPGLRVWGQIDPVSKKAHLWIQNNQHTWRNVVENVKIPVVTGDVKLYGFNPGSEYRLQWWDTRQSNPSHAIISESLAVAQADGSLTIAVNNLTSDIAVKISSAYQSSLPVLCD